MSAQKQDIEDKEKKEDDSDDDEEEEDQEEHKITTARKIATLDQGRLKLIAPADEALEAFQMYILCPDTEMRQ